MANLAPPPGFVADTAARRAAPLPSGFQRDTQPPNLLRRTFDTAVQGTSDAFSAAAGDSFSTQGDRLPSYLPQDRPSRVGGAFAGAAGNIASDIIMTGGKALLPEAAEEAIGSGVEAVASSAPVQAVGKTLKTAEKKFPYLYDQVANRTNIAALVGPKTPKFSTLGEKFKARYIDEWDAQKRATKVGYMLEPDKVDADGKMVSGTWGRTKYAPGTREKAVIEEVTRVKGVKPDKSFTHNREAVEAEINNLYDSLNTVLDESAGTIKVGRVISRYNKLIQQMADDPHLAGGDAGDAALSFYKMLERRLKEAGPTVTPRQLMDIRREFDKELKAVRFDFSEGAKKTAQKTAGRQVRQMLNDLVEEAVPGSNELLGKQSRLLNAHDVLWDRSWDEARGAAKRFVDNFERSTGVSHPRTGLAMKATVSDIPTTVTSLVAATIYGTSGAISREARSALRRALDAGDAVVNNADKAVLLALLNQYETQEKAQRQEESK